MTLPITAVHARAILDCRGFPTLQVEVTCGDVSGHADVPAGRSTGSGEARELRDGGTRYGGFDVQVAVGNVNNEIGPALAGRDASDQRGIDTFLRELDGTPDKSRLGGNALCGVSLAVARVAAAAARLPLHRYLRFDSCVLPVPLINLVGGGRLTSNDLAFQEFIMMPVGARSFSEALRMASETHMALQEIVVARYGKLSANTGDEGDFATPIVDVHKALALVHEGVAAAGYKDDVVYGLDAAASHFWDPQSRTYAVSGRAYTTEQLIELYKELVRDYDVASIEDPLDEDDWEGFAALTGELAGVQVGGAAGGSAAAAGGAAGGGALGGRRRGAYRRADRRRRPFRRRTPRACARASPWARANALLWKVNQIGTLTEAFEAADVAFRGGYGVCVSERSGETEDPIIADLAVALNCGQIKTGSPVRGERTAKYNRLLQIEEWLGSSAIYAGRDFRRPVTGSGATGVAGAAGPIGSGAPAAPGA